MQLKLICSNVIIKSCNISNVAKAIISLQNEGTQVDSGGNHYFNDYAEQGQ
jgi:biotin operon repressor